jgi:hypothetical protein
MVAGRSLPTAANGAAAARSLGCERERIRGKERREEEERVAQRFKYLNRANHISATDTHASQGIWSVSYATAVSTIESCQSD